MTHLELADVKALFELIFTGAGTRMVS